MITRDLRGTVGACRLVGTLLSLSLALTGCRDVSFIEGGPEIRYLTSKPPVIKPIKGSGMPLMPLDTGTRWEMRLLGPPTQRQTVIDARIVKNDSDGSLMEIRKDGQIWRREVYRNTPSGLYLAAMGEDSKPMMRLSPRSRLFSILPGKVTPRAGTAPFGTQIWSMPPPAIAGSALWKRSRVQEESAQAIVLIRRCR
jgi:hypothetical protein